MKIRIQKRSIDFTELTDFLVEHFPQYSFWLVGDNTLKIGKNKYLAAYVRVKKHAIVIRPGFMNFKQMLAFTLLTIGLAIIPPLMIYYLFVYPSVRRFIQSIADAIYYFYRNTVLNYTESVDIE
jgi:hypothetical protein